MTIQCVTMATGKQREQVQDTEEALPKSALSGQQTETRLPERDMDQNSGEENKGMQTDMGYHQSIQWLLIEEGGPLL